MQKPAEFLMVCLWLSLCSASVYAQEEGTSLPQAPAAQPAPEQPSAAPVEVVPPTDQQGGTILPGFGFPYSPAAGITGAGIIPFSQNTLVTGTGIIPYARKVSPSTTLFQVNQTLNYSDNVLAIPENQAPAPNLSRGDFYSITTATFSPSLYLGNQVLFAHATYGINRYLHNAVLDSDFYSLDAGANWRFTHLCSGTLLVARDQHQVPFTEQVSPSIQTTKTESINETAKCGITGHVSAILDSGWSRNETTGTSGGNDYTEQHLRTGLEYSVAKLNTLRAQVTFTNRDFFDRSDILTPGLASGTRMTQYELYYQRDLTPKLSFNGTIGIAKIAAASTPAAESSPSSESSGRTYSAALVWKATPKTTFEVSTARGLGPPLAVLADFQKTDVKTFSINYRYSPRLSFNAAISKSLTDNSTVSGIVATPVLSEVETRSASLGANYDVSPFMKGFFAYSYNNRIDAVTGDKTISNLYVLGLTYSH